MDARPRIHWHAGRLPPARRQLRRLFTAAQVALAWVLAQGDDIIPIPGTKCRRYLDQNIAALDVVLSAEELAELDRAFPPDAAAGLRYPEAFLGSVNV